MVLNTFPFSNNMRLGEGRKQLCVHQSELVSLIVLTTLGHPYNVNLEWFAHLLFLVSPNNPQRCSKTCKPAMLLTTGDRMRALVSRKDIDVNNLMADHKNYLKPFAVLFPLDITGEFKISTDPFCSIQSLDKKTAKT